MRVIFDEIPSDGQTSDKSGDNKVSSDEKKPTVSNVISRRGNMEPPSHGETLSIGMEKLESVNEQKSRTVSETVHTNTSQQMEKERKSSSSENDANADSDLDQTDVKKLEINSDKANIVAEPRVMEKMEIKSETQKNLDKTDKNLENNVVDELTTKVIRMKDSVNKRHDAIGDVTSKLMCMNIKETSAPEAPRSPKLRSKGPDGGKATSYNQYSYGVSDWSAVRVKEASGKRGRDDEAQPFKFTRNIEAVESSDYNYIDQTARQTYPNQMVQTTGIMNPFGGMNNLNNLNKPQVTGWQGSYSGEITMPTASSRSLSGGSVTVRSPDCFPRQPPNFSGVPPCVDDWDGADDFLKMFDDSVDSNSLPAQQYPYPLDPLPTELDPPIVEPNMTHATVVLQKQKRSPSGGDESGYDSEAMSTSSPYSESLRSPESGLGSPASASTGAQVAYLNHSQFSPAGSVGAGPLSVDSAHSMGSPVSYQALSSPASQMSLGSPASYMSASSPITYSPVPSPDMLGVHYNSSNSQECQAQATIVANLQKPIPVSPVDKNRPWDLEALKDVYDVIGQDLKEDQEKTIAKKAKNPKSNPQRNIAVSQQPYAVPFQVNAVSSKSAKDTGKLAPAPAVPNLMNPVTLSPVNALAKTKIAVTGNTASMGPVVLGTVAPGTTVVSQPPVVSGILPPQLLRPVRPGQNVPIVMPQPIVPVTSGQSVVWIPVNAPMPMAAPSVGPSIIVIRSPAPANQKKGGPTRPRPILPKMPQVMPSKNSDTTTTSPTDSSRTRTTATLTTKTQTVPSNTPTVINNLTSEPRIDSSKMTAVQSRPAGTRVPVMNNGNHGNIPTVASELMSTPPAMMNAQMQQSSPIQPGLPQTFPLQGQMECQTPNKLNLARRYVAAMKKDELHFQDQDGDTYLHVAICRTDPYLVKALLERLIREGLLKVMIDQPNKKRQTPLYVAVAANHPMMVQELVKCGADPNCLAECQWNNGMRKEVKAAIHCAAQGGTTHTQTLYELLRSRDLNLNLANSEGLTAIHCAIQEHMRMRGDQVINSIPTMELLIRAGADPNVQDKKSGKTPLMYAIETKDSNLVQAMVNLLDKDRLRAMLRTQTFDGSSCSKICSGLKMDHDVPGWKRINALILSVGSSTESRGLDMSSRMS